MHIPRLSYPLHSTRPRSVRGGDRIAVLMLMLALVAGLACDENAPTETRASSGPSVLGTVGEEAAVAAGDITTQAIALPVNQSVSTAAPNPAFRVNQTGTGPNGIFQISRAGNTQSALQGLTNGTGSAGFFRITNPANAQPAVDARTNGTGVAVQGIASGNGTPGAFRVTSTGNTSTALLARTSGNGPAGRFEATHLDNPSPTLVARTVGTGHAIHAITNNDGDFVEAVGKFEAVANGDALWAVAHGSNYHALQVDGRSQFDGNVRIDGNLNVTGTLTKGAGSFRIDHPLDPEHKYLSHSFVESPDMMNVYNGNATLDSDGRAAVKLPDYFEALNRDFRYQLTAIGAPGPNLYIAEGVQRNQFRIAGGRPYARVSWQVTGVRQDAYANDHRIKVEEEKLSASSELVASH